MSPEGDLGNLGEPTVSLSEPPEEQGDRLTKSPGAGWKLPLPNEPVRGHKPREQTGYWEASGREATQEGQRAVLAEHSTAEGGEVRPKRPTGGKARPGIPFDWEERWEILRDPQPSQHNSSGLPSRQRSIQRWSLRRWLT
jgi:hypothetical protein